MSKRKILVACAWPYVNGKLHIGHLAGYFIPGDIFARYSRLKGWDTLMVSGSDCHGTPITVEADKRGLTPQDIIEEFEPRIHEVIKLYDFSYDIFTKTTTENHAKITQEVFLSLLKNGYITKDKSFQYYSETESRFLPDRYVEGECPHCHAKEQRADQCENCGRSLGLGELINPVSKLSKSKVELKETEHYFIDYPKLQEQIKEFVLNHESVWKNWVFKETLGFIDEGLQPRAITRDLDWGVAIPKDRIDPEFQIENIDSKKFYVWFDAVIGYYSAAVEYCEKNELDVNDFWKNPDSLHYYFMGQDNLTFHTIFWPGQLIGMNEGLNLPHQESIVKFLNVKGSKLSKSRGNIIDATMVAEKFSPDVVRYYITSVLPENKESNWDWNDFRNKVNSELVGNIGNFIHRTLSFYNNKLGNEIQNSKIQISSDVQSKIEETFIDINDAIFECKFVDSINLIRELSTFGNQYFDHNKPWTLIEEREKCEQVLFDCLQLVNAIHILIAPILPDSSKKLNAIIGAENLTFKDEVDQYQFNEWKNPKVIGELLPMFRKIEEEDIKDL